MSMNLDGLSDTETWLRQIEQLPLDERASALGQLHDELKEFLDTPES